MKVGKAEDLRRRKFGKLTVTRRAKNIGRATAWCVRCECGNETVAKSYMLKAGRTKTCGCRLRAFGKKAWAYKHGSSHLRLYNVWKKMLYKCYRPYNQAFHIYGARGIIVCEEWKNDFKAFQVWAMSNGYNDELDLTTIDIDKNFEPSNCQFRSRIAAAWTRERTFTVYGESMSMKQFKERVGIND